ncbi:agmatinase [Roseovarius sp. EL26]|uniref:agmatinase n=1 Tax=Roseovarius sp. EL26 TaxID=2126672 RepID=UPI000EA012DA|nr:agmatinase [Roseovarius sp. EL26]
MSEKLVKRPSQGPSTYMGFPFEGDLDNLSADIAILGIPFGMPYSPDAMANDQSFAPDALRHDISEADAFYDLNHYDFDVGGPLLDNRDIKVVDCGNVVADMGDHAAHYRNAEAAVRKIMKSGSTLISIGGDHGIPIPILRGMEELGEKITLVQVDAHIDWRDDVNGETNGYSSPIRRASEMDWIGDIVQIGIRGTGSARTGEVELAKSYGADIITAYEMHDMGMQAVLDRIPDGGPYYLTVDADGLDPTIMPAVITQAPGGLSWVQMHKLIHGLVNKGRVVGMDLVEIAPSKDVGNTTMVHARRLINNFIGATVRANYYEKKA